jgi:hypothetical protein
MTPAIPTAKLGLAAFITRSFGGIVLPTHLCQTLPQFGRGGHANLKNRPGTSSQQGFAQLADPQLAPQLALGLAIQVATATRKTWSLEPPSPAGRPARCGDDGRALHQHPAGAGAGAIQRIAPGLAEGTPGAVRGVTPVRLQLASSLEAQESSLTIEDVRSALPENDHRIAGCAQGRRSLRTPGSGLPAGASGLHAGGRPSAGPADPAAPAGAPARLPTTCSLLLLDTDWQTIAQEPDLSSASAPRL